jgi:hypothetical protein
MILASLHLCCYRNALKRFHRGIVPEKRVSVNPSGIARVVIQIHGGISQPLKDRVTRSERLSGTDSFVVRMTMIEKRVVLITGASRGIGDQALPGFLLAEPEN